MCMGCNTYDTGIFIQLDVRMYFANIHISHFNHQWNHGTGISIIKRIFCFHLYTSRLTCDILPDAFKWEQYMWDKYVIISHTKSGFSLRGSQTNANAITIYDANLTHYKQVMTDVVTRIKTQRINTWHRFDIETHYVITRCLRGVLADRSEYSTHKGPVMRSLFCTLFVRTSCSFSCIVSFVFWF